VPNGGASDEDDNGTDGEDDGHGSDTGSGTCLSLTLLAHRDKSREWRRLKANVEPLLTVGNSGKHSYSRNVGKKAN